ncbi:hypothetical protein [Aromatoleum aromaticum]|uniref:hypothetical protein n=1 Tax=Aromatoleum aromaticum TaxID=551760 RepID=UPI0012FF1C59|nr:hypothetical protein [Aromatoleum aromaticum]NMG56860.1 hypothetical protein [Aromatoleum aromaticum]
MCEDNQVENLLGLAEKLLAQIETDAGLAERCLGLFEQRFAVRQTVKQIVAALE